MIELTHRLATPEDVPKTVELMQLSILENMKSFLSPAEIEAAQETMGVDWTLIEDQTYFVIETPQNNESLLVGCGGWGKRRTLYGGDHTVGRDDTFSDPTAEAARIRAMYTHPLWARCGVETFLLEVGERSARDTQIAANGAQNVVIKMVKVL